MLVARSVAAVNRSLNARLLSTRLRRSSAQSARHLQAFQCHGTSRHHPTLCCWFSTSIDFQDPTPSPSMTEMDYETYQGTRFCRPLPESHAPNYGPIHVVCPKTARDASTEPPTTWTLYHNFQRGLTIDNGTRKCFGTRKDGDGKAEYEWLTYAQVFARVERLASGMQKLCGLQRQSIVGVFSNNRLEWSLVEHASHRMSYILVPLYDTLGPDAVPYIVNHTEMRVLFHAKDQFETILRCKESCSSLNMLIQFEDVTDHQREQAQRKNLILKSFKDVEAMVGNAIVPAEIPSPDDLCTICYTSGTTGTPKGVMLKQKNLAANALFAKSLLVYTKDDVHLSYLPLAHIFERFVQALLLQEGGAIGFYQGDVKRVLDDAQVLKPTVFSSVPRLFNRIYDKVVQDVDGISGITKVLFNHTSNATDADGRSGNELKDTWVFNKIRSVLGGRVRLFFSGSAPLHAEVKHFLQVGFGCPVVEGYGITENGGVVTVSTPNMPLGAHCGVPIPNCEMRLRDVPEMDYTSEDKPRPRGEILIRGDMVFSGYYKQPEVTAEVLDKDGWFATGDIGCWNADGTLSIIDRKKNIFKLSQGEYIALEKIEAVYLKSPFIAQIFVYGDSSKNSLVAIVVPDPEVATTWCQQNGKQGVSLQSLCTDPSFKSSVAASMTQVGKQDKLFGFEMVKQFHMVAQSFSMDLDLVTPTFKLKRPQLKKYFQAEIDHMYSMESARLVVNSSVQKSTPGASEAVAAM